MSGKQWSVDKVKAGTLTIASATVQKSATCATIGYEPLVLGDGIESTNDPVLRFRSTVYALSYAKWQQGLSSNSTYSSGQ